MCEDCTMELVMVAKFLEKCTMSTVALDQLKQQIVKLNESKHVPVQMNTLNTTIHSKDADLYYESIDYCDENVEYVTYESATDIIEEANIFDQSHETQQTDDIDSNGEENNRTTDKVCLQIAYSHSSTEISHINFVFRAHHPEALQKGKIQIHREK